MIRRLASIVVLALLASAFSVSPALAVVHNCATASVNARWFDGEDYDNASSVVSAAITIDLYGSSDFRPCIDTNGLDTNAGASAWTSIVPAPGNPEFGDSTAIIQVGIIDCDYTGSACDGNLVPHFFWAYGGCSASPTVRDLGVAGNPYAVHDYEVRLSSTGVYGIYIDGAFKNVWISKTASAVACWADQGAGKPTQAEWLAERWDVADSIGSAGTKKTHFTNARYQVRPYGSAILTPYLGATGGNCDYTQPNSGLGLGHCVRVSTDDFDAWND